MRRGPTPRGFSVTLISGFAGSLVRQTLLCAREKGILYKGDFQGELALKQRGASGVRSFFFFCLFILPEAAGQTPPQGPPSLFPELQLQRSVARGSLSPPPPRPARPFGSHLARQRSFQRAQLSHSLRGKLPQAQLIFLLLFWGPEVPPGGGGGNSLTRSPSFSWASAFYGTHSQVQRQSRRRSVCLSSRLNGCTSLSVSPFCHVLTAAPLKMLPSWFTPLSGNPLTATEISPGH